MVINHTDGKNPRGANELRIKIENEKECIKKSNEENDILNERRNNNIIWNRLSNVNPLCAFIEDIIIYVQTITSFKDSGKIMFCNGKIVSDNNLFENLTNHTIADMCGYSLKLEVSALFDIFFTNYYNEENDIFIQKIIKERLEELGYKVWTSNEKMPKKRKKHIKEKLSKKDYKRFNKIIKEDKYIIIRYE